MAYYSLETLDNIKLQIQQIENIPSICCSSKDIIHEISVLIDIAKNNILNNDVPRASPIRFMRTIKTAHDLRLPLTGID